MNNLQFEYFLKLVSKVPILKDGVLYKKTNGIWSVHDSQNGLADSDISFGLKKISEDNRLEKIKNPNRLIIGFSKGDYAISITIGIRINSSTIDRYTGNLDDCEKSSASLFHANHDELTNVLNRNGIKHELGWGRERSRIEGGGELTNSISGKDELVIYSFDIDKFKSVNDVYGHEAGDVVLSAFSARISKFIHVLEKEYSAKFIFGRPGGEEFELILIGALSLSDKEEIADRLINEIRNPALPSQKEVDDYGIKKKTKGTHGDYANYPSGVKASIGVAWGSDSREVEGREEVHKKIRKQADAALYRAKEDGRNCVRIYNDIKNRHGRIVKYFNDSEIVQIDIGSSVGVEIGDVYAVHFPPFTGSENVRERDGGEKILGQYPNVESGKIIVVEIEREFSICVIAEKLNNIEFPKKSRLSYVHVGSKFPVYDRVIDCNKSVGKISSFKEKIDILIRDNRLSAVCRLSGKLKRDKNEEKIISLDSMTLMLTLFFPSKTLFYKPHNGGLFVAIEKTEDDITERKTVIEEIFLKAKDFFVRLGMQVCMPEMLPEGICVDADALLFYCQSSVKRGGEKKDEPYFFTEGTPANVIYGWRGEGSYKNALIDYKLFRNYGFSSANLHNQMGLSIFEADARDYFYFSEMAFLTALRLEANVFGYAANLATIRTKIGKYEEAYKGFCDVNVEEIVKNDAYIIAYGKSVVEACKKGLLAPNSEVGSVLRKAVDMWSKKNKNAEDFIWLSEIKTLLINKNFD